MKFIIDIPELFVNTSGIYKIKNNINFQVYIGRTKNFINRAKEHKYNFERGLCNSKINKFLEENPKAVFTFEVIDFTSDIKEKEEEKIAFYKSADLGFNILHNDEEFKELFSGRKFLISTKINKQKERNKKERLLKISKETNLITLQRGYIREKGVLKYKPQLAKEVLGLIKIEIPKEKIPKKNKKKRITMKDKSWKPMDFSFFYSKKV